MICPIYMRLSKRIVQRGREKTIAAGRACACKPVYRASRFSWDERAPLFLGILLYFHKILDFLGLGSYNKGNETRLKCGRGL